MMRNTSINIPMATIIAFDTSLHNLHVPPRRDPPLWAFEGRGVAS